MPRPRNIFLVGFMASGKTRVGAALSRMTGWDLVDADDELVRRAGKSIACIFKECGEADFREMERSVINDLCSGERQIIAAGGGAFVDDSNRSNMLNNGLVVCLSAKPETIYRRVVEQDGDAAVRPLLAGPDPLQRIKDLLAQRAGAYAQAHHTIETDELTPEQVAERVVELLKP